ncbi:TPA: DNA alkylation repair protein [Candidatus Micrarchaeota archaeon]|nr:DNA alkylation repair protein [Candidatus Micrarchaeota archaeon]HIH30399.1 DNA alkylation repair protein [Candidatus Micrarchaeota archaeon]
MKASQLVTHLRHKGNPRNLEGMAKFGINTKKAVGVQIPHLRQLAKNIGTHHNLASDLWNTQMHEARLLAGFIDDPLKVTERQMEDWVEDFDSWDICDQVCSNLFDKTDMAHRKAVEWSHRKEEYVKRAGYVLMACLAVHDKRANAAAFEKFFPHIIRGATDERNYVKKAVNWALRQIGKRSMRLNKEAIEIAKKIGAMNSSSAKWIAADALRELESEKVQNRIKQ